MASKTYNPKLVTATFIGVPLTGFADGAFVAIAKNEDAMMLKVGADGESAVAVNANESGRITVSLLSTSGANDYLSMAANLRLRGTLQVKDLSGRSIVVADDAWIVKQGDRAMSKEVETIAWVFETGNLQVFNNGNL